MKAAIAQHLNVSEAAIVKVEEWATVLFAVVKGLGGRFISKKVVQTTKKEFSYYEVADRICDLINESGVYDAKLWDKKAGETRIYVSYRNRAKTKDCGYVKVCPGGIYRHLTLQAGTIEAIYEDLKSLKIAQPKIELVSSDELSEAVKAVVEECWECGASYTSYGNVEDGNMCCRRCA